MYESRLGNFLVSDFRCFFSKFCLHFNLHDILELYRSCYRINYLRETCNTFLYYNSHPIQVNVSIVLSKIAQC